jgi:small GTP-binding protein
MVDAEQRVKEITEELHKTKRNKATEHHIGPLLARRAQLQRDVMERKSRKIIGGGFDVKKQGDATVVMLGFPSVGKSTLLTKLTNAKSKIAAYEFTTLECIPGIMEYKSAKIQLLDIPGIIEGAQDGKGRGREVLSVARKADLIMILLAVPRMKDYDIIMKELWDVGIRLGEKPPNVDMKKDIKGGISIITARKLTRIGKQEIIAIMNQYGMHNATITIKEDITPEQLIDVLEKNRVYINKVVVVNKVDLNGGKVPSGYPPGSIGICAERGLGLEEVREKMYEGLRFMRVYTKTRTAGVNMDEPMMLRQGDTVRRFVSFLPRDFRNNFRYALIWGKSVKFPGQRVGLFHVLAEGDVLHVIKKG